MFQLPHIFEGKYNNNFIKKDVYKFIDYLAVDFHPQALPYTSVDQVYIEIMKLFGTQFISWH